MSGHSKWSTIKHKKGAADARRGKLFSKLSRAIIVAAREGGPDPAANLALQNAIEKARSYSMPKDNIERAIAKGSGAGSEGAGFETVVYEGYGPAGVAVLLDAMLIRLVLMPVLLRVMGRHAWALPRWLDRVLPDVDVEGTALERRRPHPAEHR